MPESARDRLIKKISGFHKNAGESSDPAWDREMRFLERESKRNARDRRYWESDDYPEHLIDNNREKVRFQKANKQYVETGKYPRYYDKFMRNLEERDNRRQYLFEFFNEVESPVGKERDWHLKHADYFIKHGKWPPTLSGILDSARRAGNRDLFGGDIDLNPPPREKRESGGLRLPPVSELSNEQRAVLGLPPAPERPTGDQGWWNVEGFFPPDLGGEVVMGVPPDGEPPSEAFRRWILNQYKDPPMTGDVTMNSSRGTPPDGFDSWEAYELWLEKHRNDRPAPPPGSIHTGHPLPPPSFTGSYMVSPGAGPQNVPGFTLGGGLFQVPGFTGSPSKREDLLKAIVKRFPRAS